MRPWLDVVTFSPRPIMWKTGSMARLGDSIDADLEVDCPRCGSEKVQRFYGPCEHCRVELRTEFTGEGRDVAATAYEPKMNVTPNAVATKD